MNGMVKVKHRLSIALVDVEHAQEALHAVGAEAANLSDEDWIRVLGGLSDGRSKLYEALDTLKRAEAA